MMTLPGQTCRHLGSWKLPTGNGVDLYLVTAAGDTPARSLTCEWDRWPPSGADIIYYTAHIVPELAEVAGRALNLQGKVLWVTY